MSGGVGRIQVDRGETGASCQPHRASLPPPPARLTPDPPVLPSRPAGRAPSPHHRLGSDEVIPGHLGSSQGLHGHVYSQRRGHREEGGGGGCMIFIVAFPLT